MAARPAVEPTASPDLTGTTFFHNRSAEFVVVIATLQSVLKTLRRYEGELRRLGVSHAVVFGSVARGKATEAAGVDLLVEPDDRHPWESSSLPGSYTSGEILDGAADVVNRRTIQPLLRDGILRDAAHVFWKPRAAPARHPGEHRRNLRVHSEDQSRRFCRPPQNRVRCGPRPGLRSQQPATVTDTSTRAWTPP